ncbi:MAG: hypothetical protein ACOYMW_08080 [Candidatus Competibacteraceae bacterium]
MSLLTELNGELLTESGLPLLAEDETEGSGSGGGTSGGSMISVRGKATVALVASTSLTIVKVFTRLPMQAKATLRLSGNALLKAVRGIKALKATAALRLLARQGTAKAPSGLAMQMNILTDPTRPDIVLDQYLLVWFNGHPSQCRIALKIDDGAEFQPAFTWENPGVTAPAIVKIASAEIAGDGMNHRITVSVWQAIGTQTSARSTFTDYAKTPNLRPATQPEWCGATSIRQGETIRSGPWNWVYGNIPDLTRIEWRHTGAVQIIAKIPVRNIKTGAFTQTKVTLGYADHDETRFYVENLGLKFGWSGGNLQNVLFGVAAIHHGTFGPITWANAPVKIREVNPQPQEAITNPDELAGTLRRVTGHLDVRTYPGTFNLEIRESVLTDLGALPTNGNTIIDQSVYRLFLRIKNITREGGSVTLDNLGRFEARWNPANTLRSVVFVASPGFVDGTKAGILLTDPQAKALNP